MLHMLLLFYSKQTIFNKVIAWLREIGLFCLKEGTTQRKLVPRQGTYQLFSQGADSYKIKWTDSRVNTKNTKVLQRVLQTAVRAVRVLLLESKGRTPLLHVYFHKLLIYNKQNDFYIPVLVLDGYKAETKLNTYFSDASRSARTHRFSL